MKSGDYSVDRLDDAYFRQEFARISNRVFTLKTFFSHAALVAKQPVNGHRMWKEFDGEAYDNSKFDLVEGMWDHEHCSICYFSIQNGFSYWENAERRDLLCDACHEALLKSAPPSLADPGK